MEFVNSAFSPSLLKEKLMLALLPPPLLRRLVLLRQSYQNYAKAFQNEEQKVWPQPNSRKLKSIRFSHV